MTRQKKVWEGAGTVHAEHNTLPALLRARQHDSPLNPFVLGLDESFVTQTHLIKSLVIGD